jgi:hypothetical protein
MDKHQSVRSPYEFYLPELEALFKSERVQSMWESITTFDPMGMWATRPTHAGTYAIMSVPELVGQLTPDPKIVNEDGSISEYTVTLKAPIMQLYFDVAAL